VAQKSLFSGGYSKVQKRGKNARKTPKNASKSTIRATVQNPQKITKKCNLPKSTRRKLTKRPFFCIFTRKNNMQFCQNKEL
jgi:hypothetical protein